ncbi:MAG TPA: ATP-binding protein [Candidatus Acidoferrum sp.]|nr:ATP-binding protein [Candidatus Acidoferrum sp.]
MSFRTKLLLVVLLTIFASVSVVAYAVTYYTRSSFEAMDQQRTDALVEQFKKEFAQRGEEISRQVENIANAEITLRTALDAARPNADLSIYVHDANGAAQDHGLDFVELVNYDGTLISSAQYPSRVGYKVDWVTSKNDWTDSPAFLKREELPTEVALSLCSVRTQPNAPKPFYIIGGRRLDKNFLASLVLPAGMRALIYTNLDPAFTTSSLLGEKIEPGQADRFAPLVENLQKEPQPLVRTIEWTRDPADAETFHAIPLTGRNNELLGIFFVGSSRRELVQLTQEILKTSAVVAAAALFVGLLVSFWISARITKPVEELAEGAREVATGRWDTRIEVRGSDEVGQLAIAFNDMTRTLASQKERLLQTERVAAWRELARRLAHELRNPLFPMQITIENLQKARRLDAKQFLEVFNESTATLKAELANLNTIVGRFSDFSKMPAPKFVRVNVNEVLRNAVRLFEPQFTAVGKPTITQEPFLTDPLPDIDADPDLLHRAFQNLVLNAMDAMPAGGTLTLRTSEQEAHVRIEVADTGKGLTQEECKRLFTPYYTTKQMGTGLGLAIVQSVVSDHRGNISVTSEEGRGTTFRIDLPERQPGPKAVPREPASESKKDTSSASTMAAASD